MSAPEPDRVLNCMGFRCPEPVLKTRIEIDKMLAGQIVEVIADDPAAEEDIKSLVKRIRQELVEIRKEGTNFHFYIKKVR